MGRLRVLSGREVCRILQQHGFAEVRRRGSHVVMQRRTDTGIKLGRKMGDVRTYNRALSPNEVKRLPLMGW